MNILIPKKGWTVWDVLKGMQDPGWKHGRSAKAYVAGDLVGAEKTILLCGGCKHGFRRSPSDNLRENNPGGKMAWCPEACHQKTVNSFPPHCNNPARGSFQGRN